MKNNKENIHAHFWFLPKGKNNNKKESKKDISIDYVIPPKYTRFFKKELSIFLEVNDGIFLTSIC